MLRIILLLVIMAGATVSAHAQTPAPPDVRIMALVNGVYKAVKVGPGLFFDATNLTLSCPNPELPTPKTGLPTGLTLTTEGVLSGTPKESGLWMFLITVTDSTGAKVVKPAVLLIKE